MSEQTKRLSGRAREALETAELRIRNFEGAQYLWERVLTQGERKRLDDNLELAYQRYGGTLGLWLNVRGGTLLRALVEVAYSLGFLTATDREWLLRELGDQPAVPILIEWNRELGELRFNGELIRKVRKKVAKNVIEVFDAFQDNGWVKRIEDPLSVQPDGQTLRETIRSLILLSVGLYRI